MCGHVAYGRFKASYRFEFATIAMARKSQTKSYGRIKIIMNDITTRFEREVTRIRRCGETN